jgi:hypothetical protein
MAKTQTPKERASISLNDLRKQLRGYEDRLLKVQTELRQFLDATHVPATVVPNTVSAARSAKVALEHIRAALFIADDLD